MAAQNYNRLLCSESGCGNFAHTKGLCQKHAKELRTTPRPCAECGELFVGSWHRICCSDKCYQSRRQKQSRQRSGQLPRYEFNRMRREQSARNFTCVRCGTKFYRAKPGTEKYLPKYCSRFCRKPVAPFSKVVPCIDCGVFVRANGSRRRCGPCTAINNRYAHRKRPIQCKCRNCTKPYLRVYPWPHYGCCSAHCLTLASDRSYRDSKRKARRKYGKTHRSRARRVGVAYEPIDRIAVFQRDGWRCQICGRSTPRSLLGQCTNPKQPTLDHRQPVSKGGPHTYANVQCACRECNTRKGNRFNTGQLPLFPLDGFTCSGGEGQA